MILKNVRVKISRDRQIFRALLAAVPDKVEGDLGSLNQRRKTRLLDGRDMDEHVLGATVRLDETVTLRGVEPLHSPARHAAVVLRKPATDNRIVTALQHSQCPSAPALQFKAGCLYRFSLLARAAIRCRLRFLTVGAGASRWRR
jgi:hypothetical protein